MPGVGNGFTANVCVYEYREWHGPQISALAIRPIGALCAVSFESTP